MEEIIAATAAARAPTSAPSPQEIVARARAMIPVLAERSARAAAERMVARETVAEMQAAGLFRVLQPRRWGGYEMDPVTYYEVQLALAEGDMATGWIYGLLG